MKTILSLILLLSSCSTKHNISFYKKVTDDFERHSYFLSLEFKFVNENGRYIVKNTDLYFFLNSELGIDQEQYKELIRKKLIDNSPLEVSGYRSDEFIKVVEVKDVNLNARNGPEEFINIYFNRGYVLKDSVDYRYRAAIIQKLFEWEIAAKIDDETGYLIIER